MVFKEKFYFIEKWKKSNISFHNNKKMRRSLVNIFINHKLSATSL